MRNSIYPRYTIGNRGHTIFDLNSKPGLIQGITKLFPTREVKVSDLAPFEHLRPGDTKEFTDGQRIEIVDFGGCESRGGFVSTLNTQVIDLEAGARLTGPVVWRAAGDNDRAPVNDTAMGRLRVAFRWIFPALWSKCHKAHQL